MNGYAIRTTHLTRDFAAIRAVNDVSLEVESGTVFGFLGPNGAGKTTTIRLLLGLLEPSAGSAEVLGYDTRRNPDEIRRRSGALLEHHRLYERLSAYDNLEFYGRVWHMPKAERRVRIKELLTDLKLWDRRDENAGNWSRGMKQKLAVARTLLHRPKLIFLDEPTAGLDPVAAAALRDDLAGLARSQGVTIFLTTHNLTEAEKLCQRVGVIRQGKLVALGSPDDLRNNHGKPRVEISGRGFSESALGALRSRPEVADIRHENGKLSIALTQAASSAPIIKLLVESGAEIEEVRKGSADLEQAFLSLLEEEKTP
ncbi:MAG: ABC transporter ATP-binding protein [Anaerolineales bacterium]